MGTKQPFDEVEFIMDLEGGNCSALRTIDGIQHLIGSGVVWKLQGCYGRMAAQLIGAGHCHAKGGGMGAE